MIRLRRQLTTYAAEKQDSYWLLYREDTSILEREWFCLDADDVAFMRQLRSQSVEGLRHALSKRAQS